MDDYLYNFPLIIKFTKIAMAHNQVHYASDVSHWKKAVLQMPYGVEPRGLYAYKNCDETSDPVEKAIKWLSENISGDFYIKEISGRIRDRVYVGFEDEDEALYFQMCFF